MSVEFDGPHQVGFTAEQGGTGKAVHDGLSYAVERFRVVHGLGILQVGGEA